MTETRIRRGGTSRLSVRPSRPTRKTNRRAKTPLEKFLASLPVSPALKVTDRGLVDVRQGRLMDLVLDERERA